MGPRFRSFLPLFGALAVIPAIVPGAAPPAFAQIQQQGPISLTPTPPVPGQVAPPPPDQDAAVGPHGELLGEARVGRAERDLAGPQQEVVVSLRPPDVRDGGVALNRGSTRTEPVKFSAARSSTTRTVPPGRTTRRAKRVPPS